MLQEVGILPILVFFFHSKGYLVVFFFSLRGCLVVFSALRAMGMLPCFGLMKHLDFETDF